jgi:Putative beta barrel porin-7 (BBP7)
MTFTEERTVKKLIFTNLAMMLGCFGASISWGQYPGAYGSLGPSSYPVQPQVGAGLPQVPQAYVGQTYPGHVQPMQAQAMQQTQAPGWLGQRNGSFQLVTTQEQLQQQAGQAYAHGAGQGVHQVAPQTAQPAPQYGQSILVPAPMPDPMTSGQAYDDHHAQGGLPMVGGNSNQPLSYQSAPSYQTAPVPQGVMNPVYGQTIAPGCTSCGSAPIAESYGYPVYGGGHFGGRMSGFSQSMFTGMPDGAKTYFGGANALVFRRVDNADRQLTYNVNMPSADFLGTRDARFETMGGFEGFAGRYFNCGRNAVTLGYWGLYPDDESAMVTTNGGADLRSRYHFNGVEMPAVGAYAADTVYNWYDDAVEHRIVRTSDYQNIEANLLGFMTGGAARSFYLPTSGTLFSSVRGARGVGGACGYCGGGGCGMCGGGASCGSGNCGGGYANYAGNCGGGCAPTCAPACAPTRYATGPCCLTPGCGSRLNMTWLAGVRYFRFKDTLSYQASRADTVFNGGNDDIYYDTAVKNDLVGFQVGGILNYCTGRRASLYMLSKMGIYGNHAQYDTSIGGRATPAFINSPNAYNGNNWMVSTSKTDVAFIGELGSGVWYRLSPKWSANVGYKAVVASGVATAVDQIPLQMVHLGNVADFNNNGSLILHGLTLGGAYNY